jgi:hypothetical protein
MLFLAPIVFVGILGNHHDAVEHQLGPSLDKVGITELAIPDGERAAIVKHTAASKKVIKSLHVGGVVAGELTGAGADRSFRVVIYDGEGNLTSDLESPIAANGLTKANIHTFEANIADIAGTATPAAPTRVAAATPKRSKKAATVDDAPLSSSHVDDDAPPGFAGAPKQSTHPAVATAAPADDDDTTAAAPAVVAHAPATGGGHAIHLDVAALGGIVGRSFAPDPNTVQKYNSTPVPTGGIAGTINIGARAHIAGSFEHSLVMHTAVGGNNVTTGIGRYEALATYDVLHGSVRLGPAVGFGARYFAMDTDSNARSPDIEYQYVMLGATVAKPLGARWLLSGLVAYEPVVGGVIPGMSPSRYGLDLGAALEVRATAHVFARAAFDVQQFATEWPMAGGANDVYPSGTIAVGAAL